MKQKLKKINLLPILNRNAINFEEMAGGLNKRKMIQSAVFKGLVEVSPISE